MQKNTLKRSINWKQGTALSLSAVIGCGILILPATTARAIGPVSILVWAVVSFLMFPIVFVLGKLATKVPKAGGITSYATEAFGPTAGVVTSWIYLGSIPIGLPSIALSGTYYLKYFYPFSFEQLVLIAGGILLIALFLNIKGIDLSSKVGTAVVIIILSLLVIAIIFSVPYVRLEAFRPFMPRGWQSIFSVISVIFFAFAGWEMIAPLAEEFENPRKDIPKSLFLSALLITILYIAISYVTIGTGVYLEKDADTLLGALMSLYFGKFSGSIVAVVTLFITFCTIHANIAGFSRIVYNQSREGGFPKFLSKLHPRFQTPVAALVTMGVGFTLVLGIYLFVSPDLNKVLELPGTVFLASYMIALIAALKLLEQKSVGWWCALITLMICIIIYFTSGMVCLFPIILGSVGYVFYKF